MAKEDENLFGQKLEDVGVWIYDRLLAQTERIGRELDVQLFAVCADFVGWTGQFKWRTNVTEPITLDSGEVKEYLEPAGIDYRVETVTDKGKRRTLEVERGYRDNHNIVREFVGNHHCLRTIAFVNPIYSTDPHLEDVKKNGFPHSKIAFDSVITRYGMFVGMGVGILEPNDNPLFLYENSSMAASSYVWTHKRQDTFLIRERYVRPGFEHLPDPIGEAREIVEMLRRGKIIAKRINHPCLYHRNDSPYNQWQPV